MFIKVFSKVQGVTIHTDSLILYKVTKQYDTHYAYLETMALVQAITMHDFNINGSLNS